MLRLAVSLAVDELLLLRFESNREMHLVWYLHSTVTVTQYKLPELLTFVIHQNMLPRDLPFKLRKFWSSYFRLYESRVSSATPK